MGIFNTSARTARSTKEVTSQRIAVRLRSAGVWRAEHGWHSVCRDLMDTNEVAMQNLPNNLMRHDPCYIRLYRRLTLHIGIRAMNP